MLTIKNLTTLYTKTILNWDTLTIPLNICFYYVCSNPHFIFSEKENDRIKCVATIYWNNLETNERGKNGYWLKKRYRVVLSQRRSKPGTLFKSKFWSNLDIENKIYREEFTRKKCKTAILLYCFHTAGVLHIFMLYNLLGPGISF